MVVWPIEAALSTGADRIVVVLGHGREAIETALRGRYPASLVGFALQAEQRGTGHAVICALETIGSLDGDLLVLYGDTPNLTGDTISTLIAETRDAGSPVGLLTAHVDDTTGYGRIVRDESGRVSRIVEHRDATAAERRITEINVGTYLFDGEFLESAIGSLAAANDQGELYLTDLVELAGKRGCFAHSVVVADLEEVHGVNTRGQLARAERVARRRRNEKLMEGGVTLRDPERIIVESDVVVAADVTLETDVVLRGHTRVETGAVIDVGVVAIDSRIGANATIRAYSHLEEADIGERVQVGPFARLRPGTVIHADARIGNFVETKKTVIGRGSKASHLSYLGDAVIGEGVNIGAGTITCNYDGVHKHQTTLEDGVFIGSNSQLIAPVTVGAGAYVAAGSTVTEDVPPDALAVARSRQHNVEGWAKRNREDESKS
jgi:bifunctional UDP-N-acetylglucosamine pyrophosphorylase/glucosamine-1-phosphate N-acetyltransferase